ncbi:MAG TPA: hypothetical protein VLC10_03405, partial [Patescibacteria group bacterium]|nr:hypothetical protein [Patescibacteria group bacterium]
MDDQHSTTPMSDFLHSLSQKTVGTATAEKSADAAGPADPTAVDLTPTHAPDAGAKPPEDPKIIHANKVRIVTKALRAIEQNIANIIRLLEEDSPALGEAAAAASEPVDVSMLRETELAGIRQIDGRVVEGVFDGQSMVGSDGKIYTVPPNYASKSKLVEGDLLKLTITPKGSFIYKQIGPIERSRVVASLGFDATNGEFYATAENKRWSVIKASVTYFKGEPGDEVVLLVPKNAPSKWAAVENIIKKSP